MVVNMPSVNPLLLLMSITNNMKPRLVTQDQAVADWPRDLYLSWPLELG